MIIVDIEVPMIGKNFDFQISEETPLCRVKEEIVEMICLKEQCQIQGKEEELLMWNAQNGSLLRQELSARENALATGSRILLV